MLRGSLVVAAALSMVPSPVAADNFRWPLQYRDYRRMVTATQEEQGLSRSAAVAAVRRSLSETSPAGLRRLARQLEKRAIAVGRSRDLPFDPARVLQLTAADCARLNGQHLWFRDEAEPAALQQVLLPTSLSRDERKLVRKILARASSRKLRNRATASIIAPGKRGSPHKGARICEVMALRITRASGQVHTAVFSSGKWDTVSNDAINKALHGLFSSAKIPTSDPPARIQWFHNHPYSSALSPRDLSFARNSSDLLASVGMVVPVEVYSISPVAGTSVLHKRIFAIPPQARQR